MFLWCSWLSSRYEQKEFLVKLVNPDTNFNFITIRSKSLKVEPNYLFQPILKYFVNGYRVCSIFVFYEVRIANMEGKRGYGAQGIASIFHTNEPGLRHKLPEPFIPLLYPSNSKWSSGLTSLSFVLASFLALLHTGLLKSVWVWYIHMYICLVFLTHVFTQVTISSKLYESRLKCAHSVKKT